MVLSDSDSDDNVPLSKLRADASVKREAVVAVKAEPIVKSEPGPNGATAPASTIKREAAVVDSDSDDNVPISSLAQRQKRVKVEPNSGSQSRPTTTATATRTSTRPAQSKKKRMKIKFKQQECTEELYGTLKGRLVQELLCRWWYVIEWPPADTRPPSLHGLQELDGFRGTYIRVKGDDMGSIVETRPQIGKPSFIHFFAMPSTEIQKLLLKAYEKQMEVLKEHEGPDAPMLKELKSALLSASKISPDKAERSVTKILKKYRELTVQIQEIQEKAAQGENTGTEEEDDAGAGDDDDDDDDDVIMDAGGDSAENTNDDEEDDE